MNNTIERDNPFWKIIIVFILILGIIFSIFRIRKAQVELGDHLTQKKEALKEILLKIEVTKLQKERFVQYKNWSRIICRYVFVGIFVFINYKYLKYYSPVCPNTLPQILGLITDLNAVLLLLYTTIVFLLKGNFLKLDIAIENTQNRILAFIFQKKEQLIETILNSNIESEASIRKEILETEKAIEQNDVTLNSVSKDFFTL